jgi:hypothetical protein
MYAATSDTVKHIRSRIYNPVFLDSYAQVSKSLGSGCGDNLYLNAEDTSILPTSAIPPILYVQVRYAARNYRTIAHGYGRAFRVFREKYSGPDPRYARLASASRRLYIHSPTGSIRRTTISGFKRILVSLERYGTDIDLY